LHEKWLLSMKSGAKIHSFVNNRYKRLRLTKAAILLAYQMIGGAIDFAYQ